jgi:hypothetical protein
MARNGLEEKLEAITREFVAQIVATIRGASFAEVAEMQVPSFGPRGARGARSAAPAVKATRVSASPGAAAKKSAAADGPKPRQTADRRAELGERVVGALERASSPLGVRALSSELGVAPDLLAAPLRELRSAGRIAKHGEKRATTYSVA